MKTMQSICRHKTKYILVAGVCLACSILATEALAAVASAGPLPITQIHTGWASDSFLIQTSQTIINPAGCPTPDGYVSDSSQSGYNTHYAAALMAFVTARPVTVIISDTVCFYGRPVIMGVNVTQ